jgi:hypothetical protein
LNGNSHLTLVTTGVVVGSVGLTTG